MKIRWSCCSGASIIQMNAVVSASSTADAVMGVTHRRSDDFLVSTKSKSARTDMPAPGRRPPAARPKAAQRRKLMEDAGRASVPGRFKADLGEERPHRIQRAMLVEIDVRAVGKSHEALGLVRQRKQPLAERDRNHAVALAMQHQERRGHLADPRVGAERVLHQEPHRQKPIGSRADVDRRGERRLQHEAADPLGRRERDGDAGAERFAEHHDPLRGHARGGKRIGGFRIRDHSRSDGLPVEPP